MAKNEQRHLVLLEEQTMLSRERTMQQYMTTGLAFIGVGLIMIRLFLERAYAFIGAILIVIGFWQIWKAYQRFRRYRHMIRKIRKSEKQAGLEIGE